jgi:hypothetical protein
LAGIFLPSVQNVLVMSRNGCFLALVFVAMASPLRGLAQPGPLQTLKNTPLFFPASDLVTNGVPGLTNPALRLMVSAVAGASSYGGSVSLVSTQVWARYYSSGQTAQATSIGLDKGGNVYVAGSDGPSYVTAKYSAAGVPLWTNRYAGPAPQNDLLCGLALDGPGNAYIAGTSRNTNGVYDVVTLKYSSNGMALWTNRFNNSGTNGSAPQALEADATGNSYVLAGALYLGTGAPACTLLKYDPAGNAVWTDRYNGPSNIEDNPVALAFDPAGNLVVACSSEDNVTGEDYAVLKYSSAGSRLWTNRYTRGFVDQPSAIALDRAGNVLVTGDSLTAGPHVYATIKYASDGTPLWTNMLVGATYQGGAVPQVAADLSGNVIISGGSAGATNTGDYAILKLDANGFPLWTNRYIGLGATNGILMATATDSAGNVYAAGYSVPLGGAHAEFALAKYAGAGTPLWTNHFDGPPGSDARATAVAISPAGAVHLTGNTTQGGSHSQFATVKFADYILYSPPTNFLGQDSFSFAVTDSDGNSVTGMVAVAVTAFSQLNLQPMGRDVSGGFKLQVNGAMGTNQVVLYASTNLVNWLPVATNIPAAGSCEFLDQAALSRRFYRAAQ